MSSPLPNPRRLRVSNHVEGMAAAHQTEPGVNVLVDTLDPVPVRPQMNRALIAAHTAIPTSNSEDDGPKPDAIPGSGIVVPGGANIYYLDLAPHSESPMHRTPSTDYVIVLNGELTVATPPAAFDVVDGRGSYGKVEETVARAGDVVIQRGCMHALANRTGDWVRLIGIVLGAEPVKVEVAGEKRELGEAWLQ
ncbi:hypothetical protein DHEL01_v211221 [Diaporthe helianthi]|uniref:Cupin type-1 domain-containing protein n=1 Tax=Diaporthe helianthi TaxID=158607 RepID=A0A2P5HJG4_DIAHE|nr:hypothetical protein DHEL01_v211221 [Diaporthe helianthi]